MTFSHRTHRVPRWLFGAAALALTLVGSASAEAAARGEREPYSVLQSQIAAGQVKQATVVKKRRLVRVRLRNGRKYKATYPSGADPTAALRAHGAQVRVKAPPQSSHVRVRYIVLAVAAALALAGAVAYLVRRRRGRGPPAEGIRPPESQ